MHACMNVTASSVLSLIHKYLNTAQMPRDVGTRGLELLPVKIFTEGGGGGEGGQNPLLM